MAIRMRQGLEENFNPGKLLPGEWAVATDAKKVWMCFSAGIVYRMATYDAFEEDMKQIQQILATCEDIQTAVEAFERLAEQHESQAEQYRVDSQSWAVGGTGTRDGEDTNNSQYYSRQAGEQADRAKTEADRASAISGIGVATVEKPGIVKPDNHTITVDSDGTMRTHYAQTIEIPGEADLNNYKNPGSYACYLPSAAESLANSPTANAFMMMVGKHAGAYQEITEFISSDPKKFMRNFNATDGWGEWYRIYTTADPPPITNNLLATVPGTALDAMQGKALDERITENAYAVATVNSKLNQYQDVISYTKEMGSILDIKDSVESNTSKVIGFFSSVERPSDFPYAVLGTSVFAKMVIARYAAIAIIDITNINNNATPNHTSGYYAPNTGFVWSDLY